MHGTKINIFKLKIFGHNVTYTIHTDYLNIRTLKCTLSPNIKTDMNYIQRFTPEDSTRK